MGMIPFDEVVRFVDAFQDNDPSTIDTCPGNVNGHNLIRIAHQKQRRLFRKDKVKNIIYLERGTTNIWYKKSKCNAGVVAMGFSLRYLGYHPKAITMIEYYHRFTEINAENLSWLDRNDFVMV